MYEQDHAMPAHLQSENVLWGGTAISALEHNSELVSDLSKLSGRGNFERLDLMDNPVVQRELGVSGILPVEPFRDLLGRPL